MSSYNVTPLSTLACECNLTIGSRHIYNSNAAGAAINVPFAIIALVSNTVVILTVFKTQRLHRPANILLCSLAFGDFLAGAVVQPVIVVRLLFYNAGVNCCLYNKVNKLFEVATPIIACGSFVQVCVMCWDRYRAVSSPFIYRSTVTNKKMLVITGAAWLAWLALYSCLKYIPSRVSRPFAILAMASFIIICVVSQIATLKAMRRHNNQVAVAAPAENTFAREKKMAVTLRWILATMVLSVLPQIMYSVSLAITNGKRSVGHMLFLPWVRLAFCLSSSLNPLIYFWRHDAMRSAALQFITCKQ